MDDCLVSVLWCPAQRAGAHSGLVLFPHFRYYVQRLRTRRRSHSLSQVGRVVRGVVRCSCQMSERINMTLCYNGECWAVSLVRLYKPILETLTVTHWYLRREGLPHIPITLTLKLLMLSITLALIYHTLENFHVLKEILLIGVYVLFMLENVTFTNW